MNAFQFAFQGDAISQAVAIVLLLMSVTSWVVILIKAWSLRRARKTLHAAQLPFGKLQIWILVYSKPVYSTLLN